MWFTRAIFYGSKLGFDAAYALHVREQSHGLVTVAQLGWIAPPPPSGCPWAVKKANSSPIANTRLAMGGQGEGIQKWE